MPQQTKVLFCVEKNSVTNGYGANVEEWKTALLAAVAKDPSNSYKAYVDDITTVNVGPTTADDVYLKVTFTCQNANAASMVRLLLDVLRSFQKKIGDSNDAEFPLTGFEGDDNPIVQTSADSQVTHLLETGIRPRRETGHGAADRRDPYAWYRAYY
eukprot:277931_1